MPEAILFLARHGETSFNLEDKLGGNSALTGKGIQQAREIGKVLQEINFQCIYTSPLKRALRTASIIAKYIHSTPIILRPELVEIKNGDAEGMTYKELKINFSDFWEERKTDKYGTRFPGGENYFDVSERIKPVLDEIRTKEGNVLIVGHQSVNRCILGNLLNLSREEIPSLRVPNDVLFGIDLEKLREKSFYLRGEKYFPGWIVQRDP